MNERNRLNKQGQTTTEYALLVCLIAIMALSKIQQAAAVAEEQLTYANCMLLIAKNLNLLDASTLNLTPGQTNSQQNGGTTNVQMMKIIRDYLYKDPSVLPNLNSTDKAIALDEIANRVQAALDAASQNTISAGSNTAQ